MSRRYLVALSSTFHTVMLASTLLFAFRRSTISAFTSVDSHKCVSYYHATSSAFGWKARLKARELKMSSQEVSSQSSLEEKNEWNIAGLKKETERNLLRCHKKIQKVSSRLSSATKQLDDLTSNESATLEQLEQCPDIDSIQSELNGLRDRLQKLNELESMIDLLKKSEKQLPDVAKNLVKELDINDSPPPRPERGPGKAKGPRSSEKSRLPYRRFYSKNIEIRVGKQATDNDELSCNPKFRDGSDWWMHASGR